MIRYRFVLLGHRLKAFAKFASVNEVNAYLLDRKHHLIYIEVQAYDDREWMERPAWINETVSNREWFDDHHDQLYKMIEDYGPQDRSRKRAEVTRRYSPSDCDPLPPAAEHLPTQPRR